jgi:hypothetical protein
MKEATQLDISKKTATPSLRSPQSVQRSLSAVVPPQERTVPSEGSSDNTPSWNLGTMSIVPKQFRNQDGDMHTAIAEASRSAGTPLNPTLATTLHRGLGYDFSSVLVHQGQASKDAAYRIGARAFTLGTDIHLGQEAHTLADRDRDRLLIHEAVHTIQQGGRRVAPHAGLTVSRPSDAAEQEAEQIAASFTSHPSLPRQSRSLAMRDAIRADSGRQTIARMVTPQLQRDLTGKHKVNNGEFDLNLKTESHPGAKSGMSGTIKFTANDKAPDAATIRLMQALKLEDLSTGKDYVWTGGDANRNKTMTSSDPANGVEGGWHVDINPAGVAPRTAKGDAAVSPYYRDYWPNATSSQDGSKKGKAVSPASLWDYPGWSSKCRYSFETLAKGVDTNYVYGTVMWGFTISDGAKGTVEKEYASGRDVTLRNTDKAIEKFNEYYRNPGASTAP